MDVGMPLLSVLFQKFAHTRCIEVDTTSARREKLLKRRVQTAAVRLGRCRPCSNPAY